MSYLKRLETNEDARTRFLIAMGIANLCLFTIGHILLGPINMNIYDAHFTFSMPIIFNRDWNDVSEAFGPTIGIGCHMLKLRVAEFLAITIPAFGVLFTLTPLSKAFLVPFPAPAVVLRSALPGDKKMKVHFYPRQGLFFALGMYGFFLGIFLFAPTSSAASGNDRLGLEVVIIGFSTLLLIGAAPTVLVLLLRWVLHSGRKIRRI